MALAYLLDPTKQYQNRAGVNNVDGWLEVFLAGTDDHADVYVNFDRSRAEERIGIDNNGRAVMIVEAGVAYRVEMHEPNGELVYTQEPIFPVQTDSSQTYDVICSDGSIYVDKYDVAGTTTFDLSTNNEDNVESLDWFGSVGSYQIPETDMYRPSCVEGTMELGDLGVFVGADKYYHVTAHLVATKNETRQPYYEDISVKLKLRDVEDNTWTTVADIGEIVDYSMTDEQEYEISTDIMVGKDSELVFFVEGQGVPGGQFEFKDVKIHRVYSGAPKLPETCASKNWVSAHFEEKLTWNYNSADKITGVNGSAFAGGSGGGGSGVDPEQVSAIASAYADSAASGKLDKSASALFQPSGDYQTAGDYAYNSSLSSKLDSSAFNSSDFYPTSNPSGFVTGVDLDDYATTAYVDSAVSGKLDSTAAYTPEYGFSGDRISSIDGSALVGGGDYSGIQPVNVNNTDRTISVNAITLAVDGSSISAELDNQTAILHVIGGGGDYVEKSSISALSANWNEVSAKLDTTAFNSGDFYPTSNPSGFITGVDLTPYQTTADMSGYLQTSESANYYPTSNPSGFITGVDLSDYATTSYVVSAVSGKLDSTAAYTPTFGLNDGKISSIDGSALDIPNAPGTSGYVRKDQTEVAIGSSVIASADSLAQGLSARAEDYSFAQGYNVSSKYNALAQGMSATAGFGSLAQGLNITASDNSFAQGSNAYAYTQAFAQGKTASSVSNSFAQGAGVSATYHSFAQGISVTADQGSFAQGSDVSAKYSSFAQGHNVTAIFSATAFGRYNLKNNGAATADNVSFVIGDGTASGSRHDLITITKDGEITTYSATSDTTGFPFRATIENKLDKSASSDFYSTSNPSGFITGVDLNGYATTAYVDSSVSSKLDSTASALFQPSGNYQPSGDYQPSGNYLSATESSNYYSTANPSGFIPMSALGLVEI